MYSSFFYNYRLFYTKSVFDEIYYCNCNYREIKITIVIEMYVHNKYLLIRFL